MNVKRRDGSEEEFIREKIVVAIVKAGGRSDTARAIASEIENAFANRTSVTSEEIRKEVLSRLQQRDMNTYNSWLEYERSNKRR